MSRLHELIEQAKVSNPELGRALAEEVANLEDRPSFGLVFERHAPEATELYGRPVASGDKVHVLNERGSTAKADQTLWRISHIDDTATASLLEILPGDQEWNAQTIGRNPREIHVPVENLVVVAEHTDTIFPGLTETGRVENGPEDAPAHTIINAENLHALQALTYTHRHAIDCIYIDPPYNTGAKDWKYNNDYVEADDDYRHSKWLSFMEKRLLLAKELLNPADSVLIVTIDEKEYLRLGLLLEQVFPEARVQMVTDVINPRAGVARPEAFTRQDEYIFFVQLGGSSPATVPMSSWKDESTGKKPPIWFSLMRTGSNSARTDRPNLFYPVWVRSDGTLHSVGNPIALSEARQSVPSPDEDLTAVWPLRPNGSENRWQVGAETLRAAFESGTARISASKNRVTVHYLRAAEKKRIESGAILVRGRAKDGSLILEHNPQINRVKRAGTVWSDVAHDAGLYGSSLISSVIPHRRFPFPKSLYAVEDAIRFFVADKPNAVVLDFFSGSGTTSHAVMRLNKQDGGKRRSIMITNNEVSADEQKTLRSKGLRPGDPEWEALGIADYVTKPRITAAITGRTPEGNPIKGDYKFTDEFPMSDGFEANARYFTLEYLNPVMIEFGYAFSRIAPMLWLRAGQVGPIITEIPDRGWDLTDHYAVIENCDDSPAFLSEIDARSGITHVFVITDNTSAYQRVAQGLDDSIEAIQLYESYLTNFAINASRVLH